MIMVMKNISVQEPPGHHEIIAGVPLPGPLHEHLPEIHKYWEPFKVGKIIIQSKADQIINFLKS